MLFFVLFTGVGSALTIGFLIWPLLGIWRARAWVAVPCVILSSEVETVSGDDGDTYRVKIAYRYEFQNVQYESQRYSFVHFSSSGRAGKQAIVDRHRPGGEAICYVNPRRPQQAVLDRGFQLALLFGLLPLLFAVIGWGGLIFCLLAGRKKIKRRASRSPPAVLAVEHQSEEKAGMSEDLDDLTEEEGEILEHGPTELKAAATPLGRLFGTLLICLFWNGIVSVFVGVAISSWWKGDPQYFLMIFLIPFVLIGLLLVFFAVHAFLSLFNPRPTITIVRGPLRLGGLAQIRWQLRGNTYILRRLRIYLQGVEKATYRRGTSTTTDTATFAEINLVDTTRPHEIPTGSASASIPERTMHSFDGGHNKIEWSLCVVGTIAWWPDVNEQYPLPVLPPAPLE